MPKSYPIVKRNVEGRYYVDESCIYCKLCLDLAPDNFAYDSEQGVAFVMIQPGSHEQHELMTESINACPTSSIGDKLIRNEDAIDDMGLGRGTTPKSIDTAICQIVYRWFKKK